MIEAELVCLPSVIKLHAGAGLVFYRYGKIRRYFQSQACFLDINALFELFRRVNNRYRVEPGEFAKWLISSRE